MKSLVGILSMRVPPHSHSALSIIACPMLFVHLRLRTVRAMDSVDGFANSESTATAVRCTGVSVHAAGMSAFGIAWSVYSPLPMRKSVSFSESVPRKLLFALILYHPDIHDPDGGPPAGGATRILTKLPSIYARWMSGCELVAVMCDVL